MDIYVAVTENQFSNSRKDKYKNNVDKNLHGLAIEQKISV